MAVEDTPLTRATPADANVTRQHGEGESLLLRPLIAVVDRSIHARVCTDIVLTVLHYTAH